MSYSVKYDITLTYTQWTVSVKIIFFFCKKRNEAVARAVAVSQNLQILVGVDTQLWIIFHS